MGNHFHQLKISDLRQETNHAVVLNFEVPEDLADTFAFRQGQYLTLRANIDGEMSSAPIRSAPGWTMVS